MYEEVSPLAGFAGSIGATGVNQMLTSYNRDKENEQYRQNMKMNAQLALDQANKTPAAQKSGLIAAGISPAVMNGGTFSPAAVPAAPMQNKSAAMPNFEAVQSMVAAAQIANINADTEGKEIENNRNRNADDTYDENLRANWRAMADEVREKHPEAAKVLEQMAGRMDVKYSKGSYDAFMNSVGMLKDVHGNVAADFENRYKAAVNQNKLNSPEAIEAETLLGKVTFDKILHEIGKIDMESILAGAKAGEASANTAKLAAEVDEVAAKIAEHLSHAGYLDTQSQINYHSDFVGLMKNKDYSGAALKLLGDIIPTAIGAASFAGASRIGAKAAGAAASKIPVRMSKAMKKQNFTPAPDFKRPAVHLDKSGTPHPGPAPKKSVPRKKKSSAIPLSDDFSAL